MVWTSEFAANRVIIPLPENEFPLDQMLKPVVDTTKYLGKFYAAPSTSDGGMLYYRTDLLKAAGIAAPPTTWAEMIADCKKIQATPEGKGVGCYAGQFEKYEGLTVNASEAINGAGGVITDDHGQAERRHPRGRKGLDFLVNGFKQGYIPKEAITYKEEEGRRGLPGRQADLPPPVALHLQPGQRRRGHQGQGQVRRGAAAGPRRSRRLQPRWPQLGDLDVLQAQEERAGLHQVLHERGAAEEEPASSPRRRRRSPRSTTTRRCMKKYPYLPTLRDSINNAVPRPKVVALRRRLHGHPGRRLRGPDRHEEHGRRPQGPAVPAGGHHQEASPRQLG